MAGLDAIVSEWLATAVSLEGRMVNGDEAEVWTARCGDQADRVVVHVSPAWHKADQLRWCHEVAMAAREFAAEAVAPVQVGDQSFTSWDGRLVTVFPFIEGDMLDREDLDQVAEAARLLARVHTGLLRKSLGSDPATSPSLTIDPRLDDDDLDRRWSAARGNLVSGVCHGDYYRRNILVAGGTIRGLIDWHDAYVGPLIGEVGRAAWEFGHDDALHLNRRMFELFVDIYQQSSDHLRAADYELIPVATRVKLRENILWGLAHGASLEDEYQQRQLRAFWELTSALG